MTVVYPLLAQKDYSELRYSLRSLEKHLPLPFEVVIVGDKVPGWITNVTQIHLPDIPGRKQLSIKRKILAALQYSGEILFMNDDVYLLETPRQEYYWYGELKQHISESGAKVLMQELQKQGKQTRDFDGHYPLVYSQDFREAISQFSDDSVIKSAYCNYHAVPGEKMQDCKILKALPVEQIREYVKYRPAFSTCARSLAAVLPVLQELYPLPSKFEI